MKKFNLLCAALCCALTYMTAVAQTQNVTTPTDPLELLPESGIVVDVHVQRILNEALPRLMAKAPVQLAELDRAIADLKARTGFDVRTVDRIVIGMQTPPLASLSSGAPPVVSEGVVIVQGRFDAARIAAAARLLLGATEEQYAGGMLYKFKPDAARMKQLGLSGLDATSAIPANAEGALAVIDRGTILFGTTASVRRSLDGSRGANQESAEWSRRNANALISIWVNTEAFTRAPNAIAQSPRRAGNGARGLQLDGMDRLSVQPAQTSAGDTTQTSMIPNVFEAISRLYFMTALTGDNFDVQLTARTRTPEDADKLRGSLAEFQQMFASGNQSSGNPFAGLAISTDNDLVHLNLRITGADIATRIGSSGARPPKKPAAARTRGVRRQR